MRSRQHKCWLLLKLKEVYILSIVLIGLSLSVTGAFASVIDPPHNPTNNIFCTTCHTYSMWWKYSPSSQSVNPVHGEIATLVCLNCHDLQGSAPNVQGHNSEVLSSAYHGGNWAVSCVNCHDPHFQSQLDWVSNTSYPTGLYLVTGQVDTTSSALNGSYISYDDVSGTTSFAYTIDPLSDDVLADWRVPESWVSKNKSGRSALLVDRKNTCSNLWVIASATINPGTDDGAGGIDTTTPQTAFGTITVHGDFTPDTLANGINDTNTFGVIYGQLIKKSVQDLSGVSREVRFFDPNGGFVSSQADGICQVCHTEAKRYTNDGVMPGTGDTHQYRNETNCSGCHLHLDGFKGSGHDPVLYDFGWAPISYTKFDGTVEVVDCAKCHDDQGLGVVTGIHNDKCVLCHIDPNGAGPLRVAGNDPLVDGVDTANGIDGDPSGEGGKDFASTCADCHDKQIKPNIQSTLQNIHHLSSKNNFAASGNCTACHNDADGAGLADADHSTAIQLTYDSGVYPNNVNGCEPCHKLDTSTAVPTDYRTNGTTTGAFVDPDNPRVHDACTVCHNNDASLKTQAQLQNPERLVPGYSPEYGASNTCFTCHGDNPGAIHLGVSHLDKVGNTDQCNWCHYTQVGQTEGATTVDPNDNKAHDACTACHIISKGIQGDLSIGLVDAGNLSRGLVGQMVTPASKGSAVNCTDCHSIHLFSDHKHPNHTAVVAASSDGCTDSCHSGTYGFPAPGYGMPTDPNDNKVHDACTACHNTTNGQLRTLAEVNLPYVIALPNGVPDGQGNDIPNNGGGECSACHGTYFDNHGYGNNHLRVSMRSGIDLSVGVACGNCHSVNADSQGTALDSWTDIKGLHSVATNGSGPCNTCHKSERPEVVATISSGQGGTDVGCLNCHPERSANHADHIAMGVVTGAAFCTGCHDQGNINTSSYFIGTIHKNNCANCHADPAGGDFLLTGSASGHGRLDTGFGNPNTCETCHVDIAGNWYNHNINHLLTNRVNVAPECSQCHSLDPFTNSSDPKTHDGCATCHTSVGALTGIAQNGSGGGAVCTTCHGLYFASHQNIDHSYRVQVAADCAGCHSVTAGTATTVPVDTLNDKLHDACSTCHGADGVLVNLATGKQGATVEVPNTCETCHGSGYFPNHQSIDHSFRVAAAPECVGCHSETAGSETGAPVSSSNNKVHDSCSVCHTANGALTGLAAGKEGADAANPNNCVTCHGSYFPNHKTINHTDVVALAPECSGCHDGTQGAIGGVPTSTTNNKQHDACSQCHSSTGALVAGAVAGNGDCTKCHGSYFTQHQNADHSSLVALATECSGCHDGTQGTITEVPTSTTNNKQHDACSQCHTATGALVVGAVAGNGDCTKCHGSYFTQHTNADHSSLVALATECSGCHDGTQGTTTGVSTSTTNNKQHDACSQCHSATGALVAAAVAGNGDCTKCHGSYFTQHTNADHSSLVALATECSGCHDGTQGTITGVPTSTTNNKQHDACSQCHTATGALVVGAVAGNGDCTKCHGSYFTQHTNADHSSLVALATECSGCHDGTQGTTTGVPTSTTNNKQHDACSQCHTATGALVAAAVAGNGDCTKCHGSYFTQHTNPDHSSLVALATECSGCHDGTQGTISGVPTSTTNNKRHDACSQCHSATGALVVGAVAGNGDCTKCHGSYFTQHNNADHSSLVALATECSGCHDGTQGTTTGVPTSTTNNKQHDACSQCHTATGALVAAAVAGNGDCTKCHGSYFTQHTNPDHSSLVALATECSGCHDGTQGTISGVPTSTTNNKRHDACSQCHISTGALVAGAVAGNGDCTKCHGSYFTQHNNADHSSLVALATECSGCHNGSQGTTSGVPTSSTNNKRHDACSQCHTSTGALVVGAVAGNGDCTKCHGNYFTQHNNADHSSLVALAPECSGCHNGTQGTTSGVPTSTTNNKRHDSCNQCHSSTGALVAGAVAGNGDCTKCHGNYFTQHNNADHSSLVALATECSGCHNGTQGTTSGVPTSTTNNKRHDSCNQCHTSTGALVAGAVGGNGDCTKCHGSYFTQHNNADHRNLVALATACSGCHNGTQGTSSGVPTSTTNNKRHDSCNQCHTSTGAMVAGAVGGNGDCTKCHGNYFTQHTNADHRNLVALATACSGCHNGTQGTSTGVPTSTTNNKRHDSCNQCHTSTGAMVAGAVGGNGDCTKCHGNYFTQHTNADHRNLVALATACSGCHNGTQGTSTGVPTSMTNNKRHDSCNQCHTSTGAMVSGAVGGNGDCTKCHGSYFTQHNNADHRNLVAMASACSGCHNGTQGTSSGVPVSTSDNKKHDSCYQCHGTNGGMTGIAVGGNGDCTKCHGSQLASVHHANSNAKSGNCGYCHADPRLSIWGGAPTGRLACRECHINGSGYVIGFNPSRTVHSVNTNGSIQNFGACFACHDGSRAVAVTPYHAKPASADCNDSTPGKGTFNIFFEDFSVSRRDGRRGGHMGGGGTSTCSNNSSIYNGPGISFNCYNISNSNVSSQAKDGLVPTFSGGGSCPSSWWDNDGSGWTPPGGGGSSGGGSSGGGSSGGGSSGGGGRM